MECHGTALVEGWAQVSDELVAKRDVRFVMEEVAGLSRTGQAVKLSGELVEANPDQFQLVHSCGEKHFL